MNKLSYSTVFFKKLIISLIVSILLLFGCQKQYNLHIENNTGYHRKDMTFTFQRDQIEQSLGKINNSQFVLVSHNNRIIPSQLDDLDKDGKWDELFMLGSLKKGEKKKIHMELIESKNEPVFIQNTNVRFGNKKSPFEEITSRERLQGEAHAGDYFQMEGPAWENNLVAFRNYYDQRNSIDIFGKVVSDMVLDSVGIKGQDYHKMDYWGLDILKVGNSLGAGGIAIMVEDTLYRLGANGKGTYELVVEGPLRSIIRFHYEDALAGNYKYNSTHEIKIQTGSYWYESSVIIDGLDDYELVTGIVSKKADTLIIKKYDSHIAFLTHGRQAEEKDRQILGLGITMSNKNFIDTLTLGKGENIDDTYAIRMKPGSSFRFYSFWMFETKNECLNILKVN